MTTPDFSKIFGSNATNTQNWSDGNYLTGWGFLGQAPPPYQLFDDYFKNTDTKLKWLYDKFGSVDVSTAINTHNSDIESHPKLNFNILKRNKAYSIGDIAYSSTIPSWVQLQCKTAGATGASEPTWGTLVAGQEVTDGTVQWRIADVKIDITQLANDVAGKVDKTTYAADFTNLLGTNGYQYLKGGTIIQWGITNIDFVGGSTAAGKTTISLPITFPNAGYVSVASLKSITDYDGVVSVYSSIISNSQLTIVMDSPGDVIPSGTYPVQYVVMGK